MYRSLSTISEIFPEPNNSFQDLIQDTARKIILIGTLIAVGWITFLTVGVPTRPESTYPTAVTVPLIVLFLLLAWVVLRILPKNFLVSQITWLTGLFACITAAVIALEMKEISYLLAMLPLIAVFTLGWKAGIAWYCVELALIFLLFPQISRLPVLSSIDLSIIFTGGLLCGCLAWIIIQPLLTTAQWSAHNFHNANQLLDEARNHRVELLETQQDLIRANSELSRLTERLKVLHQIAEEARQAKEAFVANVSHELRTPLNMIIGFSEMITQAPNLYGKRLPPALMADITAIQRNSQHLSRLVDDVLDLSQAEADKLTLNKDWVSIPDLVEAAVSAIRPLYLSKGLSLDTALEPNQSQVYCDGTRIRQVILNLLSNAGRYTDSGGACITVAQREQKLVVTVSDSGQGISESDLEKIFQPFEQLDRPNFRRNGGSGLGLYISKRFVEMHGGDMWVESEVGAGTSFRFSIPLTTPVTLDLTDSDFLRWTKEDFSLRIRTRPSHLRSIKPPQRCVILDKGKSLYHLLKRYLVDIDITLFDNPEEAYQNLSKYPAAFLAWNQAAIDSETANSNALLSLPYNTPTIRCRVAGDRDVIEQLGVKDYLTKPIGHQALLNAIQTIRADTTVVLIVDDDLEELHLVARILASSIHHFQVLRATDGVQALEIMKERQPDLVLLDIMMPEMTGYEVLKIKNQNPQIQNIPVIIFSAQDLLKTPPSSDQLIVTRGGGFRGKELADSIQVIGNLLTAPYHGQVNSDPIQPADQNV